MEQQEEEKRRKIEGRGRTTTQSELVCSFPLDLASEILLKLPAKSVVRSRCVSKSWSSITTDPYFKNSFETRSSKQPSILVFFRKNEKLFVFSFNHSQNSSSCQPVDCFHMKYPKYCSFEATKSVQGLICFRKSAKPVVWNPTMRQFLTLLKPEKSWKGITVFLGYDPIEGKHKVVCMPRDQSCDECRVLTLGASSQESWRSIKTEHKHRALTYNNGRCINGVLYYHAVLDHSGVNIIMSFGVRSEKFQVIELASQDQPLGALIYYEGRLARVHKTINNESITMWILEDAEKHKWSSKHFAAPFRPYLCLAYKIAGVTDAGEFFYVPEPMSVLKSFHILYFDPKGGNKRFRKVKFEGMVDDEFRRINGLGNRHFYPVHIFPNHIHTLMSL